MDDHFNVHKHSIELDKHALTYGMYYQNILFIFEDQLQCNH